MLESKKSKFAKYFMIIGILMVCLFPFWIMLTVSFKDSAEAISYPPTLFVQDFTLEHYINVFFSENSEWLNYFKNSMIVALCTAAISTGLSIFSGYSLSRLDFIGKHTISNSFYVIYMFSGLLLLVPLFKIISSLGLYDTRIPLILAMVVQTLPTAVFMMKSFFDNIPEELEEAAMIDGLSRFKVIIKIVIPLSMTGIISTAVYAAMIAWNDYLFASVFLSSPDNYNVSLGLNAMFQRPDFIWGEIMAASLLTSIPIIIFYGISQYLQKDDATKGGIK